MKQTRLFEYPSEKRKPSRAKAIRPKGKVITYRTKREPKEVGVMNEDEYERFKELRRRGIEYHQKRVER